MDFLECIDKPFVIMLTMFLFTWTCIVVVYSYVKTKKGN